MKVQAFFSRSNESMVNINPWNIFGTKTIITLTHWGRVTHICVGKSTIIGSDNGQSPGRRQAINWTSAGILLIEPLGRNFSKIVIRIQMFSFKKMCLKIPSAKWRAFCLGLNVLSSRFGSCNIMNLETFVLQYYCLNSLDPEKSDFRFKNNNSKYVIMVITGSFCTANWLMQSPIILLTSQHWFR